MTLNYNDIVNLDIPIKFWFYCDNCSLIFNQHSTNINIKKKKPLHNEEASY